MVEPLEQDIRFAEHIIEMLMSDSERSLDIESDIVIHDLELDIAQFLEELQIFEELQVNVPALKVGREQSIPVSLRTLLPTQLLPEYSITFFGRRRGRIFSPLIYEFLYEILRTNRNFEQDEEFHSISPSEAQTTFRRRAILFLAMRIAFIRSLRERNFEENWGQLALLKFRQKIRGAKVTTPGCHFNVSTNSPGLRVFWSGAYYLSANYFSHPTSPATSVLQAGIYLFGVDGGTYGNDIQWDNNAVISLPGQPFVHLNY